MINLTTLHGDLEKHRHLKSWIPELTKHIEVGLCPKRYGDLAQWQATLDKLPTVEIATTNFRSHNIELNAAANLSERDRGHLEELLRELHPWRKGPFNFFGIHIDTEWRSDWKWERILPHLSSLQGRTILDVGCGNGYHGWRMIGEGARLVLGIDPNPLFLAQFNAVKKYTPASPFHLLPMKAEQLPRNLNAFDTVFSMGVLYHRRSPFDHLMELKSALRPGGELVLETLVVLGDEGTVLVPNDRYAQMRNVWFLPSIPELHKWLARCGFANINVVDVNQTTTEEQRATSWMTYQSLPEFLDPRDPNRTIEGYPAPTRATFIANRPK